MGDQRGGMGEQRGQMRKVMGPETKNRLAESSEGLQELLPGIPDGITLTHIAPNLAWRAVRNLSQVSAAWRRAIHSREVYQARNCAGSTETVVLLCHTFSQNVHGEVYSVHDHAISVYSVEGKLCYELPAIPGLRRGIPLASECVSLDGKVYILGGMAELDDECNGRKEVYELDVAGKWKWKRCADMQQGRMRFACGVMNDQIYVFGGRSGSRILHESEVYDPKADAWSSIKPMMKSRCRHQVTALGGDLVVHGGQCYDPNYFRDDDFGDPDHSYQAFDLGVYHPGRNEWRVVAPHETQAKYLGTMFLASGKFHSISWNKIYVLDIGTDQYTLTDLHSSSGEDVGPTLPDQIVHGISPCVTREVNGELLALVYYYYTDESGDHITCLMQSKGFASENRGLVWEKAKCSLSFDNLSMPFIYPIQL